MSDSSQFIDLDNARKDDQKEVMEQIRQAEHCPFCEENLRKYHKQPILKETKYWLLTKNQWPYDHTKHHFLIIYRQHAVDLAGLETEAGKELFELIKFLETEYQIPGGGWAMRFGDTRYSAGTVNHLHVQFIEPDIKGKDYQPVRIKIGKSPQKLEQN